MTNTAIIQNCEHIQRVSDETSVLRHPFSSSVNAIYHERILNGDFEGLAIHLKRSINLGENSLKLISRSDLETLCKGADPQIQIAKKAISDDLELVGSFCSSVSLRVIDGQGYTPSTAPAGLHHDFYSAVQKKKGIARRAVCSYTGPATEGARNEDVERISSGSASYRLKPGRSTFSMGLMNLWSFATFGESSGAPAFIHRPGISEPNSLTPRLVLIGR